MSFFGFKTRLKSQPSNAGKLGEERAKDYLQNKGMKLVARNFGCRWGELDLIMRDDETLVIVEVRVRSSAEYGLAHETVNHKKQLKIIKATKFYIQQENWWGDVRFDVVAVVPTGEDKFSIEHIKDAFSA
ncbi:MAG: YraN family protein [Candidatus Andersenbacteria bacterium RIFCSPHIGHO2_12_FULL_46_9]|nr:MAG: YraN family protein [Candidatus Andersenbacteria bacterium RIFCSPHIGHO2_02_FULL_46_16]OGY37674.1 MAG: YraN family protein [Candidatus Andersenbacteria bacterium RIFCSPLOWO2_02_FULL_46_11]OGY38297.1 MAG: YraN family protein [Candidatus Andersenbacteria bacterium RIFCSPHIGHO2_12_FULL_46_9]OGY42944.1 MAG: YraN family protein [Candidatus Andersenbacteria bacterium RIFCSPLOWO2_12_FULL_45_8]HBE89722.1 YraN family protein [Candidatus Andersenbacteria bacterium]